MSKNSNLLCAALIGAFSAVATTERPAAVAQALAAQGAIPNFARNRTTSWILNSFVDDLLYPPASPGPITFDSAYPHFPNYRGGAPPIGLRI